MINQGDTRSILISVKDGPRSTDQAIDPDQISLRIKSPAGTVVEKTKEQLTRIGTGSYKLVYKFTESGEYQIESTSTIGLVTEVTPMTVYVEASKF